MWQQVLADAGLEVLVADADHVRLRAPTGADVTFQVRRMSWVPSPAHLAQAPAPSSLLIVPRATHRVLAAAQALGWSVVTMSGTAHIRLPGHTVAYSAPAAGRRAVAPPRHRPPWGTLTAVRSLLADAPLRQREMAARAGTSQARVSQILADLGGQSLVHRVATGYAPASWDALADWWLAHYPGHCGASSYWYSLDDLRTQTRAAMSSLAEVEGALPLLSGEVAADLLTPWRRPTQSVIYAHRLTDLADRGFVAAAGPGDATLILHAPRDPGVWPARPWHREIDGQPMPLADAMQILLDLHTAPGADDGTATTRLRAAMRDRSLDGSPRP